MLNGLLSEVGVVVLASTLWLQTAAVAWMPSGMRVPLHDDPAAAALALCQKADELGGGEQQRVLQHGLALAEHAVAANPDDARAHFGVFCNLSKQVQLQPRGLGQLRLIRRLKHEIDTALRLAPDDPDILAAKGIMLIRLPWILDGDAQEGERLIREALAKDPENAAARRYVATNSLSRRVAMSDRSLPRGWCALVDDITHRCRAGPHGVTE